MGMASSKPRASFAQFHSSRYVGGLTHSFYRYPATTSPDLVRELMLSNSSPDDVLLDPFMGGGTTIVEALANGRLALGSDLNSLALFVSRVKTTPLTGRQWDEVVMWLQGRPFASGIGPLKAHDRLNLPASLRVPLGRALARTTFLPTARQAAVVRCALLRVSQWALESSYLYPRRIDNRRNMPPSVSMLHRKLFDIIEEMRDGMNDLVAQAGEHGVRKHDLVSRRMLLKNAAESLCPRGGLAAYRRKVQLVLTSPPYPNVHVLYHRWQVEGRRETSAPYWITGQSDGATLSYYIMGSRTAYGQRKYFARLEDAFAAIRPFLRKDALVMQLVGFNEAADQLPRYLSAMKHAGYRSCHGRRGPTLVREVPNRRWYARGNDMDAGREYLLIHAPKQ
jgi:DNA modification methylase